MCRPKGQRDVQMRTPLDISPVRRAKSGLRAAAADFLCHSLRRTPVRELPAGEFNQIRDRFALPPSDVRSFRNQTLLQLRRGLRARHGPHVERTMLLTLEKNQSSRLTMPETLNAKLPCGINSQS